MKILSPLISTGGGSLAGIVLTRNRYAAVVLRQKVTPVNPQSQAQTRIRAAFSSAVNQWRNMTQADRDGWEAYAQSLTYQGSTGPYTPTGRDVFLGNYSTAKYLDVRGMSVTPGWDFPVDDGFLVMDNLDMTSGVAGATGLKVSCSNLANEDMVVYASISGAKDLTRNFWSGPFQTSTLDELILGAPASGQIEFTGLQEGKRYFARVRAISQLAPHRMTNLFILSAIATTTP